MTKYIILSLSILLSISLIGQTEKSPKLKATSTGFSFGFAGVGTANTNEDFNNLAASVNDPDYFIDPSEYKASQYNFGAGGNVNPKIYLGFTPYSKKKGEYRYDRELRLSVGMGAGIRRSFNYYRYDNFAVDTFQSVNNSDVMYSDSSIYDNYKYSEVFNDFNVGLTFLFKTNVERRAHFSAGVGLEYAFAFRSYVRIDNYNEKSIYYYNEYNKPTFDEPDFYTYGSNKEDGTTTVNNTNLSNSLHFVRMMLPLSINFRITNKTESFFNKVYLFAEMSPGVELQIVANDKTYVNPYFGFAMFGFSYRWK